MRICWFDDNRLGVVRDGQVYDVSAALEALPPLTYPYPKGDPLIANLATLQPRMESLLSGAVTKPVAEARFLSPVANPTKIIGTPSNYQAHTEEAQADPGISFNRGPQRTVREQGLFLKANSALIGPSEGVRLRFPDRRTDHEMEFGVIIGRVANNVSEAEAYDYVAGYAIALDMVVRGPEDRSLRKSVDTYAVLGPWMVTADEFGSPDDVDFSLSVNGEVRQKSNTKLMKVGLREQIAWASSFYTLYPGDIIMSGTCEGVSRVQPGDVMHCEIAGVGAMDVSISAA